MESYSPHEKLRSISSEFNVDVDSLQFANVMDKKDSLAKFREKFHVPKNSSLPDVDLSLVHPESECLYFSGNSLGLMPKSVSTYLNLVTKQWATMAVHSHFDEEFPWVACDEMVNADNAKLVGANTNEVAVMNGLTVNLHLLLIAFYKPKSDRFKILLEKQCFPSDYYAFQSQARLHNFDPREALIEIEPRQGENTLRTDDILKVIQEQGDEIAVICFSGVQYYTGQLFDIATITKAGQEKGCFVGWDLAHAVGNVELRLHEWNVDFACWCSYKYLNSGAGGIAGAFLHERHDTHQLRKLQGWWSHRLDTRFNMNNVMEETSGISSFRLSNPSMLQTASLRGSLDIFNEAGGMKPLREKSRLLTAYLEILLQLNFSPTGGKKYSFEVITPKNPDERGAQLSLKFQTSIDGIEHQLKKHGVCSDGRKPDVIRMAPVPLYNSFADVFRVVEILKDILN